MSGTLYGIGVGPGDPELMTIRAARVIRECGVVAVPDPGTGDRLALEIAREHVAEKPVLFCPFPMTRDAEESARHRERSAGLIREQLDRNVDVAFLTLGDPTIYSTFGYLLNLIKPHGYRVELIPGITSFCAASAALGQPLCESEQPLHILPCSRGGVEEALDLDGVKVLMKPAAKNSDVLAALDKKGLIASASMAERVGMAGERLTPVLTGQEQPGYCSIIIVKEGEK